MIRFWQTPKAGAIRDLRLQQDSLPALAAEKIRIDVKAVGLNFADIFALTGLYSATPKGAFTPGLEFSGVISAQGKGHNSPFKLGDRIMGVTRFGGYCDTIDIEPDYLVPLADNWSHEQGAAYLVQTLTAWYGLTELGNLKPDQTILIHSAAGGVGLQAMKLVKALGGNPVGTVSSPDKQAFLNSQGFDDVIVRQGSFSKQLKQAGRQFDLVLDAIGGEVQTASFDHLSPMGRLVVFGAAEFTPGKNRPNYLKAAWRYLKRPKYDIMPMISDNKSVMAFNLIWLWGQTALLKEQLAAMQQVNIAPPHVGHTFEFENALDAIEYLRSGRNLGKVVLTVNK
ncbi:zinc-binding dehydrogenase [Corallincola holothuriorum]|uniref:Zinc-binding dehydrogenase n=1 Tax=Corallincola holothuriorum TaxID=2282215 RepID=A0A368NJP9_9GAMM|nr:zinc-binding dehydrogenase [Corallincola holothuriorum]RCU49995.1 zinc-binding dehydrogenase [Corallincola holothuriorum]